MMLCLIFQVRELTRLNHFFPYHSSLLCHLLIQVIFLYDRTYQLFQDKLSCSTEHFIRSENNLALLCLYELLSLLSTYSEFRACLMETRDCCTLIMMGYVSINPILCLCARTLATLCWTNDITLHYVYALDCWEEPSLIPGS